MSRPGWYVENANRSYPFLRGSVGAGTGTLRQLPDGAVVDCGFVLGVDSGSTPETAVFLRRLARDGDTFTFEFATDADALDGSYLTFTRQLDDPSWVSEHTDSNETHAGSWSAETCDEPLWSGFMVSGTIASLEALLPGDGELVRETDEAVVEPALVQCLAGSYVKMIGLANADRTRAEAPTGCPETTWPFETGLVRVAARCLQGEIVLRPGYNSLVRQDAPANAVVLGASVGAGLGEPCDEVGLFDDESLVDGTLDGSPTCSEVLRSFNGVGGRLFNFIAGQGVTVLPVPLQNRVIIDVNFAGMASCDATDGSVVSVSESS